MREALVVIDVQNDYFPGGNFELCHTEQALAVIQNLIENFRERQLPVYYIQHVATPESPFFVPESYGVNIKQEIMPLAGETVIVKHFPNSFLDTRLQTELQQEKISNLVVCGMMTHMCVDTTVRAGRDAGYAITLISDACATKDLVWEEIRIPAKTVQQVYFASLHPYFAKVQKGADYLQENSIPVNAGSCRLRKAID